MLCQPLEPTDLTPAREPGVIFKGEDHLIKVIISPIWLHMHFFLYSHKQKFKIIIHVLGIYLMKVMISVLYTGINPEFSRRAGPPGPGPP